MSTPAEMIAEFRRAFDDLRDARRAFNADPSEQADCRIKGVEDRLGGLTPYSNQLLALAEKGLEAEKVIEVLRRIRVRAAQERHDREHAQVDLHFIEQEAKAVLTEQES